MEDAFGMDKWNVEEDEEGEDEEETSDWRKDINDDSDSDSDDDSPHKHKGKKMQCKMQHVHFDPSEPDDKREMSDAPSMSMRKQAPLRQSKAEQREVEELIKQMNTMQLDDLKYQLAYYKAVKINADIKEIMSAPKLQIIAPMPNTFQRQAPPHLAPGDGTPLQKYGSETIVSTVERDVVQKASASATHLVTVADYFSSESEQDSESEESGKEDEEELAYFTVSSSSIIKDEDYIPQSMPVERATHKSRISHQEIFDGVYPPPRKQSEAKDKQCQAERARDEGINSYYAGLPSEPTLVYRTGKEQWSLPRGLEAQRRLKELREVFNHPITKVWHHDLAWKVVSIMDDHKIRFTTIDIVRFKNVEVDEAPEDEEEGEDEETVKAKKPVLSPVTIWIGVFPESTTATAAHYAAQSVLALLQKYQITDVDVDFRESIHTREVGPRLLKPVNDLNPLVDVVSPLTPALGLRISTRARPNSQGTMAIYLAEGGSSDRLLGLSCRHVLIGSQEGNLDYSHHPSAPAKDVLLLGKRAYADVVDSIKLVIGGHGISAKYWRKQIEGYKETEKGNDAADAAEAEASRIKTEGLLDEVEKAMEKLEGLLDQVNKKWKKIDNRVIGHVLRSPPIGFGVSEQHFTEDWGVFMVDRTKLGDGFQGNKMDLGTKMKPSEFTLKCFPRGDANWEFEYPEDRLLPLKGVITDDLMRAPDMWGSDSEPCLLVAKTGNATGTTLGRANGVFSIVRDYFSDMSVYRTSMEWGIINYGSKSDVFSEPGDSGSIIADICGRIGGMLTGGSGKTKTSDMTYATPFWWLLKRIQASGFPNAHLGVVA
ncbi:hypothetical protein EW146_g8312 [Bondarzewia mesenterica]|uniref:Peptidase S1 domain-containing protein n=1 Tax=Bondarzewia mesenterica TaxID=1095465 RepID=A0A4S4LFG8_9AGAM|nr:hypothetical protein EW146_g8312 [Bondarzewia mesenterica]